MKIAVPLFGERVSPHFGASSEVLLLDVRAQCILSRSVIHVVAETSGQLGRYLWALGVEMIICGGIQRTHKDWLTDKGIQVLDNHAGPAEAVAADLLALETVSDGVAHRLDSSAKDVTNKAARARRRAADAPENKGERFHGLKHDGNNHSGT